LAKLLDDSAKFSVLDIETKSWNLFDHAVAFGGERADEVPSVSRWTPSVASSSWTR
jgi:hypothetical protein